jgi:hypothetical protein
MESDGGDNGNFVRMCEHQWMCMGPILAAPIAHICVTLYRDAKTPRQKQLLFGVGIVGSCGLSRLAQFRGESTREASIFTRKEQRKIPPLPPLQNNHFVDSADGMNLAQVVWKDNVFLFRILLSLLDSVAPRCKQYCRVSGMPGL